MGSGLDKEIDFFTSRTWSSCHGDLVDTNMPNANLMIRSVSCGQITFLEWTNLTFQSYYLFFDFCYSGSIYISAFSIWKIDKDKINLNKKEKVNVSIITLLYRN
jgi:hypothetical protein